jgi:hypothetical protein
MVGCMQNAMISFRELTPPCRKAAVAIVRVLRIPGTLACPTSAR